MQWLAQPLGTAPFGIQTLLGPGMLSIICKNLALNIRECVSLCLSNETLQLVKAVGPVYLVSMSNSGRHRGV